MGNEICCQASENSRASLNNTTYVNNLKEQLINISQNYASDLKASLGWSSIQKEIILFHDQFLPDKIEHFIGQRQQLKEIKKMTTEWYREKQVEQSQKQNCENDHYYYTIKNDLKKNPENLFIQILACYIQFLENMLNQFSEVDEKNLKNTASTTQTKSMNEKNCKQSPSNSTLAKKSQHSQMTIEQIMRNRVEISQPILKQFIIIYRMLQKYLYIHYEQVFQKLLKNSNFDSINAPVDKIVLRIIDHFIFQPESLIDKIITISITNYYETNKRELRNEKLNSTLTSEQSFCSLDFFDKNKLKQITNREEILSDILYLTKIQKFLHITQKILQIMDCIYSLLKDQHKDQSLECIFDTIAQIINKFVQEHPKINLKRKLQEKLNFMIDFELIDQNLLLCDQKFTLFCSALDYALSQQSDQK